MARGSVRVQDRKGLVHTLLAGSPLSFVSEMPLAWSLLSLLSVATSRMGGRLCRWNCACHPRA